jgi:anaphase-promoting complex subunit 4
VSDEDGVEVTCLAWASNSTANKTLASILAKAGNLWDDVIAEGKKKGAQPLDLPRDLASIDIESSMPKLSVLPSGGTT